MKILMVCLGNICRSPMAEGWMLHKIAQYDLQIEVDSAGTANYHVGEKPDSRMRKHALEYGVSIEQLRARQFHVSDFDSFDIIFVMDQSNKANIEHLARNEQDKSKIHLYLNELNPGKNEEVPDPYYGGSSDFRFVIELLERATEAFLRNKNLIS